MPHRHIAALLTALILAAGCAVEGPVNPSFPVTIGHARRLLAHDYAFPRPLRRPLVVVGGFLDPGLAPSYLCDRFGKLTGDARIAPVVLGFAASFDGCRATIVAAVDRAFPSADPAFTAEVDVVGVSMGGLAAEYAAAPDPLGRPVRRLRMARLFTLSSPLRGALLADDLPVDLHPLQPPMRTGSRLYQFLNEHPRDANESYAVYSYTRLDDLEVGTFNAALPGRTPWWVSPLPLDPPHGNCFRDPRLLADIAARLRGDLPLSHDPPTPLPTVGTR